MPRLNDDQKKIKMNQEEINNILSWFDTAVSKAEDVSKEEIAGFRKTLQNSLAITSALYYDFYDKFLMNNSEPEKNKASSYLETKSLDSFVANIAKCKGAGTVKPLMAALQQVGGQLVFAQAGIINIDDAMQAHLDMEDLVEIDIGEGPKEDIKVAEDPKEEIDIAKEREREFNAKIINEKLNQNDIDRILKWYARGNSYVSSPEVFKENEKKLKELLPQVSAIHLKSIDEAILSDVDGLYNITTFKYAVGMFDDWVKYDEDLPPTKMRDFDKALRYCMDNGYASLKEIGEEYFQQKRMDRLNVGIAEGDAIMAEVKVAMPKKLSDLIDEGDAIMAEVEAEMSMAEAETPTKKELSQDLMDMLNGKKEIPKTARMGDSVTKTADQPISDATKKKVVDFDQRFKGASLPQTAEEKKKANENAKKIVANFDLNSAMRDLEGK